MKNGLYIVSTPIGNLGDISSRAIKTLGESDIIICENPKHSLKLLSNLDIKKKLISLHDYNEENVIEKPTDLEIIMGPSSGVPMGPGFLKSLPTWKNFKRASALDFFPRRKSLWGLHG